MWIRSGLNADTAPVPDPDTGIDDEKNCRIFILTKF